MSEASEAEVGGVSQELAALYRAEARLLARSHVVRKASLEADATGQSHLAASLRGKARGLHEGAQQIAAVAANVRTLEAQP